ncbi:MAG: hypothetical protein P8J78_00735 [Maricaulis sp.]|jgi:hypothetical protein|nr:hypothetical protein [Maricaulis sp.]MDG2043105.1 hypothetical protein [Maricaulis sp.]
MEALPYEAQTALVSALTALAVGGSVSLFGAPAVAGMARTAFGFVMRRRLVTAAGISAITGAGAVGLQFLGLGDLSPPGA